MKNTKYYPLTYPQQRIYFSEKASEDDNLGSSMYTLGGCVDMEGDIDYVVLEKAIHLMINQYDAFRIRLKMTAQGPVQYFSSDALEKIPYYDFTQSKYEDIDVFTWCNHKFRQAMSAAEGECLYYFCIYKASNNHMGYFFKLHHIISDGWSVSLLLQIVSEYYRSMMEQNDTYLPENISQYSYLNYLKREEIYLQSKTFERDKKYWTEKFHNIPEPLFKTHQNDSKGTRREYQLNSYAKNVLKSLVKRKQLTIPAVISALTAIYFMAYYGKDEIVIGIPIYNRDKNTKKVCGLFTSNALLRLSNQSGDTLLDYIFKVKRELNYCYHHQKYPYDLLIQDIDLRKSENKSLYQVAVNYYNTELDNEFYGMKQQNYEMYGGQQYYPLQIVIKDWKDVEGLAFMIDFQNKYFKESQIDDFYSFLENGIHLLNNHPDILLKELPLITEKGRNELVYGYNTYYEEQVVTETVVEKFNRQAALHPEKIAVSFGSRSLSYQQLDRSANKLASYLKECFGASSQVIAVLMNHSPEYIIAVLAVLKAGYAFLPIDPEYPKRRILYMLDDANAAAVLTDQDDFLSGNLSVQAIDVRDDQKYNACSILVESDMDLDALAYVIYTSGSTGQPKGVLIGQRSFSNYIEHAVDTYIKSDDEVFGFFTSIAFDLTITSVFAPLASGNQIRIFLNDDQQYGLYEIVNDSQVTIIKLTPSHLMLINDLDLWDSGVRTLILGGENLLAWTVRNTMKAFGRSVDIYNEYGPTEATVGCMTYYYQQNEDKRRSISIGYPIKNTRLYVLDSYFRPLPKGAIGELYIAGECLAYGYINKPTETKEAFLPHFMDEKRKMYKTGDLVRFLNNGTIEYVGRREKFIKFRGYRIETDEIENVIKAYNNVKLAVVVCMGEYNEQAIYAFVTGDDIDTAQLRAYCELNLPHYMVPQYIEVIDQIPLNQSGKIDYQKLEAYGNEKKQIKLEIMEHENLAQTFLNIFKKVLQKEDISLRNNFFALGGDSIKAIQVSGEFKKIKRQLPVSKILNNPDLKNLYEQYFEKQEQDDVTADIDQNIDSIILTTPIMKQYFANFYQDDGYYNQSVMLHCHQQIEIDHLNDCLKQIVSTHEMLRLRYDEDKKELICRIMQPADEKLASLHMIAGTDHESMNRDIYNEARKAREYINLKRGIVLKGVLFQQADGTQYLFLTIHHLCVDGVSWRILLDDLAALLHGKKENKKVKLIKTDRFLKWSKLLYQKGTILFAAEKDKWQALLDAQRIHAGPALQRQYGKVQTIEMELQKEQTDLLVKKAAENYYMRIDELLLGVLGFYFIKQKKDNEILIMTESHGRDDSVCGLDTSRTIGWFTSVYPVLLKMNGNSDLLQELPVLKEQMRSTSHLGIGYGVHQWLLGDLSEEAEEKIGFNFLGDFGQVLDNELFSYSAIKTGTDHSPSIKYPYELEVNAMIIKKCLILQFSYLDEVISSECVRKLAEVFMNGLAELAAGQGEDSEVLLSVSDFDAVSLSSAQLDTIFE